MVVTTCLHPELVRRAGLALADAFHLRGMERIRLPAALALLLRADLAGASERGFERRDVHLVSNLAADVSDDAAEPRAQNAQFATVAVELFGMA